MLKNLFRKKSLPQEDGNSGSNSPQGRRVKRFDIVLENLEGAPEYELKHKLVIGREVGDIVINDSSISPRHATFTLQDDVVSIIDHGSQRGTFINGRKIPVGKFIILEAGDAIKLGDLDLKVKTGSKIVDESEIPTSPLSSTSTHIISAPAIPKAKAAPLSASRKPETKKKNKNKKKQFSFTSYRSANALLRVLAILGDFFLAYILLILFLPFDDFKFILAKIPELVQSQLPLPVAEIEGLLRNEYQLPVDSLLEVFNFLNSFIEIYPLVVMYGLLRLGSTFIFGTSFSQFMLGMRAGMNKIWARVGGLLRVLIGFVTWPFLIFDLPALFSRRTFKEVITFTNVYNSSKLASVFGIIFYPILLLGAFIFAPLFQGFEITDPVILNPKVEERVATAQENLPAEKIRSASSQFFQLAVAYPFDEYSFIPTFTILGAGSKTKMEPSLTIFEKKLKSSMTLSLMKSFDLAALIELALRGNPFLQEKFPTLYEYAYTSASAIEAVTKPQDEKRIVTFEKELMELIRLSFRLNLENSLDVIQGETPILAGLVHFRSSLLGLFDDSGLPDGGFIKIGDSIFLKMSSGKNTLDFLLPLRPKGRIYQAQFSAETPQLVNSLKNKIYKFALFHSGWNKHRKATRGEALNSLEVIDAFSVDYKENRFDMSLAQALYGFYFEKSAEVLNGDLSEEKKLWLGSITSVLQILETMEVSTGEGEEARLKLLNNFQDLKSAFENGNKDFFGVTKVVAR